MIILNKIRPLQFNLVLELLKENLKRKGSVLIWKRLIICLLWIEIILHPSVKTAPKLGVAQSSIEDWFRHLSANFERISRKEKANFAIRRFNYISETFILDYNSHKHLEFFLKFHLIKTQIVQSIKLFLFSSFN